MSKYHHSKTENTSLGIANDQQEAQEVKQAMKDDQSLSDFADDIRVTVKLLAL